MGLFNRNKYQWAPGEKEATLNRLWNANYDDVSGTTAEIWFDRHSINVTDCDGNVKTFEAENVPTRKEKSLHIFGTAKKEVLSYMKQNNYKFENASDKNRFMNFNIDDEGFDNSFKIVKA